VTVYSFMIGTTQVGLANLESLTTPVVAPRATYRPYTDKVQLGDGSFRGIGAPIVTWRWGFLTQEQRDQLRLYCTGKSAAVHIQTTIVDSADEYRQFSCVMVWPDEEERQTTRRLDFVLEFRQLVDETPPEPPEEP
jgi:hypothetical protein